MTGSFRGEHPSAEQLALYSNGDLRLFRHLRVARHVHCCPDCEAQVEQFRAATTELRRRAQHRELTEWEAVGDWARLEEEMAGNIYVGLAAARCIGAKPPKHVRIWRGAGFVTGLCLVFVAGWYVNMPREDTERVANAFRAILGVRPGQSRTVLLTTPRGVAVRSQGAMLTLFHPESTEVTSSFTGDSSVGVRYVDADSGQVTITNVYGQ